MFQNKKEVLLNEKFRNVSRRDYFDRTLIKPLGLIEWLALRNQGFQTSNVFMVLYFVGENDCDKLCDSRKY